MYMDRAELIAFITKAFDGVPQPESITLHVAEAHDEYDYENDEMHRRKDFVGRWQDVPEHDIQSCQTALSYVDKIGMRFYLPAYMVWYLRNLGTKSVWSEHTLYSLDNHPGHPQLAEYHVERFSLFTAEQLKACALFVKYCANEQSGFTDSNFAQKKFERFWSKYENI